jgi:hypothetical protein
MDTNHNLIRAVKIRCSETWDGWDAKGIQSIERAEEVSFTFEPALWRGHSMLPPLHFGRLPLHFEDPPLENTTDD